LYDFLDRIIAWFTPNRRPKTIKKHGQDPVFTVVKGGRNPQREQKQGRQQTLDAILDKIRLQGMASLTEEEKQFLESLKDS
jgi:hypothetical protein